MKLTHQQVSKNPETIAMALTGISWTTLIIGLFQISALILTVLLTSMSIYLIWPKFWEKFKRDGFIPKKDEDVENKPEEVKAEE